MLASQKKTYSIDMCSGPVLPKLLRFAVPLMFSSMLQLLFNAADVIVVGRFAGDNSLAAVGSTTSLVNLLTNLFLGLSIGANILAARHFGAREDGELSKTVHTSMLLSILSGLVLTVAGVAGARQLLTWMQSPPEVLKLSALYLRIYFLGMTATMLYNFGAALLRAVGDTRRPLYYLSAAGAINVVLNLLFVIVFHMDVAGVALATVISQCISAFLVVRCLMRESGAIRLDLRQLKIHPVKLRQILRVGLPAGFQGILFSLSNVVIQSSVNSFGEIVVAGGSAASSLENFVYVAMNAFHQANVSFTSQNLGAGHYRRIWRVLALSQCCVIAVGVLLGGGMVFFGPQLLQLYTHSPAVIACAMQRLYIVCLPYAICGVMDVAVGTLRGIGYSVLPMVVTLIGACGLRLVWIATVFQIPAYHTIETVYWSYPISWLLTGAAHFVCIFFAMRHLRRSLATETA